MIILFVTVAFVSYLLGTAFLQAARNKLFFQTVHKIYYFMSRMCFAVSSFVYHLLAPQVLE